MKTLIVIPARLASTRLPNKPLALINGKTMIARVYQQAIKANIGDVIVACDSKQIGEQIANLGGKFILTDPALPSGTDRIYQAYQQLNSDYQIIINLQGDLPNIDPQLIRQCYQLAQQPQCDIATLASVINSDEELHNPSIVKIALGHKQRAVYFSRSPIPYNQGNKKITYLHHIGIYAYKSQALQKFVSLPPSFLEQCESLEQLRALEHDLKIFVDIAKSHPISVDTPADLIKANSICHD